MKLGGQKETLVFVKVSIFWIIGSLLVLAACGGSDDEGPSEAQQPTSGGNGSGEVGREEFGMTEEELVSAIEDTEASIATCMDAAGFEYVPIDPVTFREAMSSLAAVPGLSDEEFVAQYGYGFSTLPPTQRFGAGEENTQIFEALSAEDQVAYERELWGDNTEATFVVMLENEDFEGAGGCTKTAIDEVFTEEQRSPTFENPFDLLVEEDSRYQAAVEEWSACMSEAGFDYESPEDGEDELLERYNDLTRGADPATLPESEQAELEELQNEERALALADLACAEEHLIPVEEQVERDISGRS
jgi:hypothetical protein